MPLSKLRLAMNVGYQILTLGTAGIIQAYSFFIKDVTPVSAPMMMKSTADAAEPMLARSAETAIGGVQSEPNIALWFLCGALVALGVYFVFELVRKD